MCEEDGMERRPALLECIGTSEGVPTNSMRQVVNNLVFQTDGAFSENALSEVARAPLRHGSHYIGSPSSAR